MKAMLMADDLSERAYLRATLSFSIGGYPAAGRPSIINKTKILVSRDLDMS